MVSRYPFAYLVVVLCFSAFAQASSKHVQSLTPFCQAGQRCFMVIPLYSQFLVLKHPVDFVQVYEDAASGSYLQEYVPKNETVLDWSQKLTIRADQDMALNPDLTPEKYALLLAKLAYESCPNTFSGVDIGSIDVDGREAYLSIVGCGTVDSKIKPYREVTLFAIIKAAREYYFLQWAERGKASNSRPTYDLEAWVNRFVSLNPIKICDSVPGQQEPAPECLEGM